MELPTLTARGKIKIHWGWIEVHVITFSLLLGILAISQI